MSEGTPEILVSIGVPVYNREQTVRQAIVSALEQSHRHIEVIISDNASTDGTEAICREVAARDGRVKYIRQETNRGPTANFNEVFAHARGQYFMWLGDDDWLDEDYVARCLNVLEAHADFAVVGGAAHYYHGDKWFCAEESLHILDEDAAQRVVHYYAEVNWNGLFYGLMRRNYIERIALQRGTPIRNRIGDDWLMLGDMAWLGKLETLSDVHVHRRLGGASQSHAKTATIAGLSRWAARYPHQSIALCAAQHINTAPLYMPLGCLGRWRLAALSQKAMLKRHVWDQGVLRSREIAQHRLLPFGVRVLQSITPRRFYDKIRSLFHQEKGEFAKDNATILLISPLPPWPVAHGSQLRLRNLLLWLRGAGYRTLLFVQTSELTAQSRYEIEKLTDKVWTLQDVPLWSREGAMQQLRRARIWLSSRIPSAWRETIKRRLRPAAVQNETPPDLVVAPDASDEKPHRLPPISHWGAGPQSVTVARAMGRKYQPLAAIATYVFNSECLEAMPPGTLKIVDTLDRQADKREKTAPLGIVGLWTCSREEERRRLLCADVILSIQAEEAAYFSELVPERPVLLVGVDQQVQASEESLIVPGRILLVSSDNPLNQHGAKEFFQDAWPQIRETCPEAHWRVVGGIGAYMPETARRDERIEIVGHVDDLEAEYSQAAVVINPVRFGTGLKIKTVEALSRGKALVTWPPGAEGLKWEGEAPLQVCQSWEEFAAAIITLLQHDNKRRQLQEHAFQFASENFAASQVYAELGEYLQVHQGKRGIK